MSGKIPCARFGALLLLLPEAGETHGGSQLQGFCLLVASDVEGLAKTGFRLIAAPRILLQQELTLKSMQLGCRTCGTVSRRASSRPLE